MPAGAFANFHVYGPAAGAMVSADSIGTVAADVKGDAAVSGTLLVRGW